MKQLCGAVDRRKWRPSCLPTGLLLIQTLHPATVPFSLSFACVQSEVAATLPWQLLQLFCNGVSSPGEVGREPLSSCSNCFPSRRMRKRNITHLLFSHCYQLLTTEAHCKTRPIGGYFEQKDPLPFPESFHTHMFFKKQVGGKGRRKQHRR